MICVLTSQSELPKHFFAVLTITLNGFAFTVACHLKRSAGGACPPPPSLPFVPPEVEEAPFFFALRNDFLAPSAGRTGSGYRVLA